jgi:hypothetical protein
MGELYFLLSPEGRIHQWLCLDTAGCVLSTIEEPFVSSCTHGRAVLHDHTTILVGNEPTNKAHTREILYSIAGDSTRTEMDYHWAGLVEQETVTDVETVHLIYD